MVVNLYMEREALHSASTPRYWFRFVDDTFVIQQQSHKQLFLDHINNIDPAIKFTVEGNQENGAIPFLDALVKPEEYNSLSISVYCKSTHTDQYLQWDSHHNHSAKYSVIGTLTHMAKIVCTGPKLFNEEFQHLREALVKCKYPRWAIQKFKINILTVTGRRIVPTATISKVTQHKAPTDPVTTQKEGPPREKPSIGHIVIPYAQGLGEASRRYVQNMESRHNLRGTGP